MWRTPSATARVKVISSGNLTNQSGRFTMAGIKDPEADRPQRFCLDRPDQSDHLASPWATTGPYQLHYSKDGGAWNLITTAAAGSRQYNLARAGVRGVQQRRAPDCRIGVHEFSETFQVVSSATVFVVSPAPGAYGPWGHRHGAGGPGRADDDGLKMSGTRWPLHTSNAIAYPVTYDPVENPLHLPARTTHEPDYVSHAPWRGDTTKTVAESHHPETSLKVRVRRSDKSGARRCWTRRTPARASYTGGCRGGGRDEVPRATVYGSKELIPARFVATASQVISMGRVGSRTNAAPGRLHDPDAGPW